LKGYPLAKDCLSRFCPIPNLIPDSGELGWCDLNIEGWTIPNYLLAKSGATHMRWVVVVGALTAQPPKARRNKIIPSPWMPIRQRQPWQTEIEYAPFITPNGAAIVALALETGIQEPNGQYYPLQTIKAMNILEILGG
jgi:hypothetical protein